MTDSQVRVPPALVQWLRGFVPVALPASTAERARMVVGALGGILVTAWLSSAFEVPRNLTWIVAPMGASAVLVFCLPASPLAQPWSVVIGNTVSALVGVACAHLIGTSSAAAASAVGLAIVAMVASRSLHPPGGAVALLMVVAQVTDPRAVIAPVLVNSLLLVAMGIVYNNATRRSYPHAAPVESAGSATEEALDAVLARYNEVLDVSRDDLRLLIDRTQRLAHERRLADTRCADVMTRDVPSVEYGTSLREAWTLLHQRNVKTLPVVDRAHHVIGVLTVTDFLRHAAWDEPLGFGERLRELLRASPATHSGKPEVVGQIMTRKVRVTHEQRTLSDLVLLFESTGHRHIPVVGEDRRLVGMVTQGDVMRALRGAVDH
jgi:CBS domain-containing membrane protein